MDTEGEINKELDALVAEVPSIRKLAIKTDDIIAFGAKYQNWYSRCVKIVELLGSDRLNEFCSYYRIDPKRKDFSVATYVIQDYVNGILAAMDLYNKPKWDVHNAITIRIINQSHILESLKSRIGTVLADVKGHLLAQIEDEELEIARKLLRVSLRGAGAVAGVVLESHLQRTAENHKVSIKKKDPTNSDLNDPLKSVGVYAIPTWRKIQHLADLRNLCDHKKDKEPSHDEIEELIVGVSAIIKTVF